MSTLLKLAFLLFIVATLTPASVALAQRAGGVIGIFSDSPGYADCGLQEVLGVPNDVYVVHIMAVQANTSQFQVRRLDWNAPFAGANYGGNLFIPSVPGGTIMDGGAIAYVGCKPLPHLLSTLTFFPQVLSPQCTLALEIAPDPTIPSGQIEVVACDGTTVFWVTGMRLIVNWNYGCPPGIYGCHIGTEETTWSRVKAMYQ